MFEPYLKSFYVHSSDHTNIKLLKVSSLGTEGHSVRCEGGVCQKIFIFFHVICLVECAECLYKRLASKSKPLQKYMAFFSLILKANISLPMASGDVMVRQAFARQQFSMADRGTQDTVCVASSSSLHLS